MKVVSELQVRCACGLNQGACRAEGGNGHIMGSEGAASKICLETKQGIREKEVSQRFQDFCLEQHGDVINRRSKRHEWN